MTRRIEKRIPKPVIHVKRHQSHDWEKIKTQYITGEISLRDLAKAQGLSFSTVGHRAVDEGWDDERQQYRNRVATETRKQAAEQELNARLAAIKTARTIITRWEGSSSSPSASEALKAADLWLELEGDKPKEQIEVTVVNERDINSAIERELARLAARRQTAAPEEPSEPEIPVSP